MDLSPLKERKTPYHCQNTIIKMINLFEKFVDEAIVFINLESSCIQGENNTYIIDINNNTVKELYKKKILCWLN